ncbi:hypothetical protein AAEU32_11865 [Pseudoalteromonas sp. SSDWG2]|uniref:hypothetical protein n=1 Tax=Pseudoalteromonas sp. SSDWG2 TaxID=3139391 RepID=UPI003BAC8522
MTKSTYNPKHTQELGKLIKYVARFLKAANDKSQWPSLYPALLVLSERLSNLNEQQGSLFQWLLSCEVMQFDYATRLHLKRVGALAVICKSQGYRQSDCQLMMMALLACDLSITNLLKKRAQGLALEGKEKERYQRAPLLSLKMLNVGSQQQPALTQILAKSLPYQRIISHHKNAQLHDGYARTVALAKLLGNYCTTTSHKPGLHFFKACALVFKTTHHLDVYNACIKVVDYLSPQLLGSCASFDDNNFIYMGRHPDNEHIFLDTQGDKPRYRLIEQPVWNYEPNCVEYGSFDTWFSRIDAPVKRLEMHHSEPTKNYTQLMHDLSFADSYEQIEECIASDHDLVAMIMKKAASYNRTENHASTLRHALSMVGLYNVGDFITRVIFEHQISRLQHPLAHFISARITSTVNVISELSQNMPNVQVQQLAALYLGYFNFFLTQSRHHFSRTLALDPLKLAFDEHNPRPMSALLGISNYDDHALHAYLSEHLGTKNQWVDALLHSEQLPFNELDAQGRLCLAIKLVVFHLYGPNHPISPWQNQVVEKAMTEHQGPHQELAVLVQLALSCAPANGI